MKSLIATSFLACAGLYLVGHLASRANELLPPTDSPTLRLGLDALTGRLTMERLAELEAEISTRRADLPPSATPANMPQPGPENPATAKFTAPAPILEAWGTPDGRIYVRTADGTIFRRLESGDLAPTTNDESTR